jgi:hypothetical protein
MGWDTGRVVMWKKIAGWALIAAAGLGLLLGAPPLPASAQQGITPEDEHWYLLPDLITLPPTELNIRENRATGTRHLRFSNHIGNQGLGVLQIIGKDDARTRTTLITQQIQTRAGATEEWTAGVFVFHPAHNHWHMEDFARYELWRLSPSGEPQAIAAISEKVSYCLRDNVRLPDYEQPPRAAYRLCGRVAQGISPGWVDTYRYYLDGQSLDITGLEDGYYALYLAVDPFNLLLELDDSNNDIWVTLEITGTRVRQLPEGSLLFRGGEGYSIPH